jgi:transposase
MLDLETGMYVGVGYSTHSEMDAFKKALSMLTSYGITIDTVALDKYYSSRKVLTLFDKETSVYVIPKKNISKIGFEWVKILKRISEDPLSFVKKYFMRNLSEAGFSADKRRFGWMIAQKRPDRQEMAMFSIALLHNVFAIRVKMEDRQ